MRLIMKTSDLGIELIKKHEGVRLEPYQDVAGLWTIGIGHLIKPGEEFTSISEEEAEDILRKDLEKAEKCVINGVKTPLSQSEFDALVSFVFNVGCQAFRNSTLLRLVNRGEMDDAAEQFARWNRAGGKAVKGLTNRRLAERELFLGFA